MFCLVWAADGGEDWSNHCRTEQRLGLLFGLVIEALRGFEGTFASPSQLWAKQSGREVAKVISDNVVLEGEK